MSEIAVIVVVGLLFLGPKLLPEIATGLGKVIREIRKATADIKQDIDLDDSIRGPLRELRDAATLPPEELKRRDEAKAARRRAEEAAEQRRQQEAKEAEEAARKQRDALAHATMPDAVVPPLATPAEVITAGGTMVASPPPSDLRTTTMSELQSPSTLFGTETARPAPPPPIPPPPAPKQTPPEDATVIDLQAQLKANLEAKATLPGRPVPPSIKPPLYRPREDKKG